MGPARTYVHLGERKDKLRRKGATDVTRFIRKNALLHRRRQSNGARLTLTNHFNKAEVPKHFRSDLDKYASYPEKGQTGKRFLCGENAFSLQVGPKCIFLTAVL